jgi:hypothetical protein
MAAATVVESRFDEELLIILLLLLDVELRPL